MVAQTGRMAVRWRTSDRQQQKAAFFFIKHSLCARNCAKCFAYTVICSSEEVSKRPWPSFARRGNRVSNFLPEGAQVVSRSAGMWIQACLSLKSWFLHGIQWLAWYRMWERGRFSGVTRHSLCASPCPLKPATPGTCLSCEYISPGDGLGISCSFKVCLLPVV